MNKLPVVAAIPNYNMQAELGRLLPSLIEHDYDDIYVLDDASTDDSRSVVEQVSSDIHFIDSRENMGAGAARNKIIERLSQRALIHFVDADSTIVTDSPAEVIRDIIPRSEFGFIGGLVRREDGLQSEWNFGPQQCAWAYVAAKVQARIGALLPDNSQEARDLAKKHKRLLQDSPDLFTRPLRRNTHWVLESNLIVDSTVFTEIGGFDEQLREHDIQDLAMRLSQVGLSRYFDPSLETTHHAVQVRDYDREALMKRTEARLALRYGVHQWFLPGGHIRPRIK